MGMWAPAATILNDELWIVGFNNNGDLAIRRDQRSDVICWIRLTEGIVRGTEDKTKDWVRLPKLVPYYRAALVPNTSPLILMGGDTPDAKTVTNTIIQYDHWNNIASLDCPSQAYTMVAYVGDQQAVVVLGGCTKTSDDNIHDSSGAHNSGCLDLVQIGFVE